MQKAFVRVPAFSNFIKDQLVLILKVMVVAAWNIAWIKLPTCQSPIRECFLHSCAVSWCSGSCGRQEGGGVA